MGALAVILSIILGSILFLILKLINKFPVCGISGNLTMWLLCCIAGVLIILLFGKLLRGILLIALIAMIIYSLIKAVG